MAEEEEKRRRRMMMEEMSKIMKKMSKDMGKLSKIMEEMSKITTREEMSSTTTTITTTLPPNLIMEILSWVPADSLISSSSFKLVSKEWHALIFDPHFVKMHLNRQRRAAIKEGGGGGLICKSGNMLFQLHPPFNFQGGGGLSPTTTTIAKTKLLDDDFGPLLLCSSFRLVGSCNGLICLSIKHDQGIILLNPSTRKFKISPQQQPIDLGKLFEPSPIGVTYGFGCCYNSINKFDEYKVVRIAGYYGFVKDDEPSSILAQYVDIYSMSLDSWRRDSRESGIRDSSYEIDYHRLGVFSNGAIHWMGCPIGYMGWDRIVSFDIRDEEFRQVPIPMSFEPIDDDDPSFPMGAILLMNMKGCLGIIRPSYDDDVNHENTMMDVELRVWVMKEYGIKESWTEVFVIRSSNSYPPRRTLSEFSISFTSTAYVLKGDQILIEGSNNGRRKLVLYDIKDRKIDGNFKMIGVSDEPKANIFHDYIETLVSLKSLLLPLSNN